MIHVLFSSSAAGTLRQLLRSRGIRDRVVDLTEWLDWGWISSDRVEDRLDWFEERAGLDWDWLSECHAKFLADVATDDERLCWITPASAQEQCGLFWFLHHTKTLPQKMIVADFPLQGAWRGESPKTLGELGPDMMGQLLDDAPRLSWDSAQYPVDKWRSLMNNGAVLRVVDNGVLRSAASDHYDEWILRWCPSQWTRWSRVVGDALGHANQQISDLFLRWRLQELIASGVVECDGELPNWDHQGLTEPAKVRRAT